MRNFLLWTILFAVSAASCTRREEDKTGQEGILVQVGDSALRVADVVARIPSGLTEQDSLAMFDAIADRWVRSMLLTAVANLNVTDRQEIDRLTEEYRNSLILEKYLNSKSEEAEDVDDASVRKYYEANKGDMKLAAPVIKGVFIKVADNSGKLGDIRRWMVASTPNSIDNIEKYGLRQATQYEYFKDHWVDWGDVAELIPYRFYDADAFLGSMKDFETQYDGSVYLLHVSEFLPTGAEMPYDYAYGKIKEILRREHRERYKRLLIKSVYGRSVKDGRIKPGLYNPAKAIEQLQ